jgi:hypothetical protein
MKILAIVLAIVISACSSVSPPNLAADFVTTVEPGAKCEPYFTDVGETHVHSARCKMPNGVISYCSVAADIEEKKAEAMTAGCPVTSLAREDRRHHTSDSRRTPR